MTLFEKCLVTAIALLTAWGCFDRVSLSRRIREIEEFAAIQQESDTIGRDIDSRMWDDVLGRLNVLEHSQ